MTSPPRSSGQRSTRCPRSTRTTSTTCCSGCGLPGGEQGFNLARVVAVSLGYDELPGATITRYCSSSLQTTRMAMHAIRAGEGEVFVSAGVETVSRFARGSSDSWPDTHNPIFAEAEARSVQAAQGGVTWHDPRQDGLLPEHLPADGPDRREPGPAQRHHPRGDGPLRRTVAKPRRTGHRSRLLGSGDQASDDAERKSGHRRRRAPARRDLRRRVAAQASVSPGRAHHRGQLLSPQRRRRRPGRHERPKGGRARDHPAGPHHRDRGIGSVTGNHGTGAGRGHCGECSPEPG